MRQKKIKVLAFGVITSFAVYFAFFIIKTDRLHSLRQRHKIIQRDSKSKGHSPAIDDMKHNKRRLPEKNDQKNHRTWAEKLRLDTVLSTPEERPEEAAELNRAQQELRKYYHGNNLAPAQLRIPHNSPDFIHVDGLDSIIYVHAALWQGDNVRISTLKTLGKLENILCIMWFSSDPRSNFTVVKALVRDLESYNFPTACAYIKCFLKNNNQKGKSKVPLFVGLVHNESLSSGHQVLLQVENRDMDLEKVQKWLANGNIDTNGLVRKPDEKRVVEFTVCMPAIFNFRNGAQLIEKLEMIKLMGAGRVVLYDTSIHPEVRPIIQLYRKEWEAGNETLQVIVHAWKLPVFRMHYRGQLISAEDCLYRYGWLSHYMVFDDMDELMIPLRHENWSQLISEREKLNPGYAAFMFRSTVFNRDHFSPVKGFEAEAHRYNSMVFGFSKRDDYVFPSLLRSKLIVNPRKIESLGVHYVYEAYARTDVIPVDQGILYHYRWPVRPCGPEVTDNRVANRFGKRLLAGLKSIWSKLKGVSLGKPLPNFNGTRQSCIKVNKEQKKTINRT